MASALGNLIAYATRHPIGRQHPLRTIGRIVDWQVRSRLHRGTIVRPWVAGARLAVRRGMSGVTGNLYFGLHECADMAFMLHFLRPDDLMLDVGANVGSYTILSSAVCGARCWSFEPAAETRPALMENIRLNNVEDRVRVFDCALSDRDGEVMFTRGLDAINKISDDGQGDVQRVSVRRLDDVATGSQPAMMKIDVEGHEEAMLAGADTVLDCPALLAIEIETVEGAVEEQLRRKGFVRRFYDPFSRLLHEAPIDNGANNSLFVRDLAAVQERLASAPRRSIYGTMI